MDEILQNNKPHKNNASRILFLAISERQKSLKFYESLCDYRDAMWGNFSDSNDIESQNDLKQNLCKTFIKIAQKERGILANAEAIFKTFNSEIFMTDLKDSSESLLLPSALPQDILKDLLDEMGEINLSHLQILALGVESHHLKTLDFLIKHTKDSNILDLLYRIQALSFNHHIPLLQGESPKENNKQSNANPPIISLNDLLNQSPLFGELKTTFDNFQHFYLQTKTIVQKLEKGTLSKEELVAFLQKLSF